MRKSCIPKNPLASSRQDFDRLLEAMKSALAEDSRAAFVFNCSSGRGRTTTAMVIAVLTLWHFNVSIGGAAATPGGVPGEALESPRQPCHSQRVVQSVGRARVGCGGGHLYGNILLCLTPSELQKSGWIPVEPLPSS